MEIKTKYEIGQVVFLITDEDQKKRMITSIRISCNGIMYNLSCGTEDTVHYEIEIAEVKTYV